eukprot:1418056-Pyramimonas_sp.AAC.1
MSLPRVTVSPRKTSERQDNRPTFPDRDMFVQELPGTIQDDAPGILLHETQRRLGEIGVLG